MSIGKMLYEQGLGKMIIITSALGWGLGSVAQIFGIVKNDKYSKSEKKFLVSQEAADAVMNIASFITITSLLKKGATKLVKSGKITTPEITKLCKTNKLDIKEGLDIPTALKKKIDLAKGSTKTNLQNAYEKTYLPFENGFDIIGTIVGSTIASNIVTPLVRNSFAAKKQKEATFEPTKIQKPSITQNFKGSMKI